MPRYSIFELYGGVPLDPRFEHSVWWGSASRQRTYFEGRRFHLFTEFSYLRRGAPVRVPLNLEEMDETINYAGAYNGNRWRYYFIEEKRYISEGVTELVLREDPLQTYQHEWDIPACFVVREHDKYDLFGVNLIDEGLELGEYTVNNTKYYDFEEYAILAQTSVTMNNPMGEPVQGGMIDKVYSGLKVYARTANALGATVVNAALSSLATQGKSDGVISLWMYPKAMIEAPWSAENDSVMLEVIGSKTLAITRTNQYTIDGYTPRNYKLLAYPYNFLYVTNHNGESATYRLEHFDNPASPTFELRGAISNDSAITIFPRSYRGMDGDVESGVTLKGFPTCAWTQDAYKIWLAQNANTQALTIQSGEVTQGLGAVQAGAGAVQTFLPGQRADGLSNVVGGAEKIYSGYLQIEGVMAQRRDHAVQPPQARGSHSSSVNMTIGCHTFALCDMSITKEFARIIDQYFDMYGYKVNAVKVPEYTNRPMWNYIKTIGCVVLGDFDADARRMIGDIFDKGLTWWRAPDTMYRYDLAAGNEAAHVPPGGGA